jgi:hypothetical protein
MSIRYEWVQGQEDIIRVVIEGSWDWDEFFVRHLEYVNDAISVERRVDFIMDFSLARGVVPPGVFKSIQKLAHMSQGLRKPRITVFIFTNALLRTVIVTFMKLYPAISKHYRLAQSVEEALDIIAQSREAEKGKQ